MRVTIDLTFDCTIHDQFGLMDAARLEVEAFKPSDEWECYYPNGPTEALEQIARSAVAARLLNASYVQLHEIGQQVRSVDLPPLIH